MIKMMLLSGVAMSLAFGALACGKNDCEDGYERVKAKYVDCQVTVPAAVAAYSSDQECTDLEGKSAQNLADSVESGTCQNIRDLSGSSSSSTSDAGTN